MTLQLGAKKTPKKGKKIYTSDIDLPLKDIMKLETEEIITNLDIYVAMSRISEELYFLTKSDFDIVTSKYEKNELCKVACTIEKKKV